MVDIQESDKQYIAQLEEASIIAFNDRMEINAKLHAEIDTFRKQLSVAREALEFYANEENWKAPDTHDPKTGITLDVLLPSKISIEGNRIAKAALSTIKDKG